MTAILFSILATFSQRMEQLGRGQVCFTEPEISKKLALRTVIH